MLRWHQVSFLSLWYDLTRDWTPVSRAIGKHCNQKFPNIHNTCRFINIVFRFFAQPSLTLSYFIWLPLLSQMTIHISITYCWLVRPISISNCSYKQIILALQTFFIISGFTRSQPFYSVLQKQATCNLLGYLGNLSIHHALHPNLLLSEVAVRLWSLLQAVCLSLSSWWWENSSFPFASSSPACSSSKLPNSTFLLSCSRLFNSFSEDVLLSWFSLDVADL